MVSVLIILASHRLSASESTGRRVNVVVTRIAEVAVEKGAGEVYLEGAAATVTGKVFNLPRGASVWTAVRGRGEIMWRLHECTVTEAAEYQSWTAAVRLPDPPGRERRLVLKSVVAARSPPRQWIHEDLLRRYCIAESPTIGIHRLARRPRVRITEVGDQPAKLSQTIQVSLQEIVKARVDDLPEGAHMQAVVQPLEGGTRWVMPPTHGAYSGDWKGIAWFGRQEQDQFTLFALYVVVTGSLLPTGRGIPDAEWHQCQVLAASPPVTVMRTVDIRDPRVRIDVVGGESVLSRGTWPAVNGSRIEGSIEYGAQSGGTGGGPPRLVASEVVLLVGAEGRDEWKVAGTALFSTQRSRWIVPSARLVPSTTRQKLMAVALRGVGRGETPTEWITGAVFRQWSRMLALSDEVYVMVQAVQQPGAGDGQSADSGM
jgi:hypothetical protein